MYYCVSPCVYVREMVKNRTMEIEKHTKVQPKKHNSERALAHHKHTYRTLSTEPHKGQHTILYTWDVGSVSDAFPL